MPAGPGVSRCFLPWASCSVVLEGVGGAYSVDTHRSYVTVTSGSLAQPAAHDTCEQTSQDMQHCTTHMASTYRNFRTCNTSDTVAHTPIIGEAASVVTYLQTSPDTQSGAGHLQADGSAEL
jgi:hypothetical protein